MALDKSIQEALHKPYSLPYFTKHVLKEIFGKHLEVFATPIVEKLNPSEERAAKSIKKYGRLIIVDARDIDLYEVELTDHVVVERNKVSIGAVVKKLIAGNNGVLANFYYPGHQDKPWRFSFIAKDQVIDDGKAVKVETNPKRYTYILGPGETCRTAAERFAKLSTLPEFTVKSLQDAFSVEKLSKKFFDEYKHHYDFFVEHLSKHPTLASVFKGDEKAVRDFTKKLLGRIVFLYFVQKKGWLGASNEEWKDGKQNFMRELFEKSGKRESFYAKWLQELFFHSLNNPDRKHSDFEMPDGSTVKVPFLNGGLFEDDGPKNALTFPPALFEDLFEFFDQYNFTIYEDSPDDHTIAVDPEMLGHIFENLLEDNKDKGAYYTPKEIVHYMCQESLIEYLATKLDIPETVTVTELGKDQTLLFGNEAKKGQLGLLSVETIPSPGITRADVERFIKHKDEPATQQIASHAKEINKFLDDVKICDPAIGSGAFPMGLLQEIMHVKQALQVIADVPALRKLSNAQMKENIIQNSIYGVDIEKGAVDIARLRFWLSLIVDEDAPRPLPNLDYKIVVGDSLLPKLRLGEEDEIVEIEWEAKLPPTTSNEALRKKMKSNLEELVAEQKNYFSARTAKQKSKIKDRVRALKIDILATQLELDNVKYKSSNLVTEDIFGGEKKKTSKQKELAVALKLASFQKTLQHLGHLKNHPTLPLQFFDWKLDFPEIMNGAIAKREGFDIVIGNPPYGAETPSEHKPIFAARYSSARSIPGIQKGSYDTFSLFIERGFLNACRGGNLHYIVPISFTSSEAMTGLHKLLEKNCALIKVSSYAVRPQPVFENAVVNSSIVFIQRTDSECKTLQSTQMYRKSKNFNLAALLSNLEFIDVKEYRLPGRLPKISKPIERDILRKIFSLEESVRKLKRAEGKPIFYRTTGGRYFKVITNYPTGSTQEKAIYFDEENVDVIGAALSSNLFFWFYQIYSDNLHVKLMDIESFAVPISKLSGRQRQDLAAMYNLYLTDIEKNAQVRYTERYANIESFKEYKIGKSKSHVDRIDCALQAAYGFTDAETEFIVNYELEFRIGDPLGS